MSLYMTLIVCPFLICSIHVPKNTNCNHTQGHAELDMSKPVTRPVTRPVRSVTTRLATHFVSKKTLDCLKHAWQQEHKALFQTSEQGDQWWAGVGYAMATLARKTPPPPAVKTRVETKVPLEVQVAVRWICDRHEPDQVKSLVRLRLHELQHLTRAPRFPDRIQALVRSFLSPRFEDIVAVYDNDFLSRLRGALQYTGI
jgi:hypothetical protein